MSARITGALVHFELNGVPYALRLDGPGLDIARLEYPAAEDAKPVREQAAMAVALDPTLRRIQKLLREAADVLDFLEQDAPAEAASRPPSLPRTCPHASCVAPHDHAGDHRDATGRTWPQRCHASRGDGDCSWAHCPQEANHRARYQSRCPLDTGDDADD